MELPFSFHSLSSPPLFFFWVYIAPPPSLSLSFVLEAEPKVIALHWQRGLSSYFSQRVPCALAGIARLTAVSVLPRSRYTRASSAPALSYSWTRFAVCACLVIELLEIPDPFYCSFDPHPRRHEGQGGVPRYLVQVLSVFVNEEGGTSWRHRQRSKTVSLCSFTATL